jgi:hypothetical protein
MLRVQNWMIFLIIIMISGQVLEVAKVPGTPQPAEYTL